MSPCFGIRGASDDEISPLEEWRVATLTIFSELERIPFDMSVEWRTPRSPLEGRKAACGPGSRFVGLTRGSVGNCFEVWGRFRVQEEFAVHKNFWDLLSSFSRLQLLGRETHSQAPRRRLPVAQRYTTWTEGQNCAGTSTHWPNDAGADEMKHCVGGLGRVASFCDRRAGGLSSWVATSDYHVYQALRANAFATQP
jgi:hypothetical protein